LAISGPGEVGRLKLDLAFVALIKFAGDGFYYNETKTKNSIRNLLPHVPPASWMVVGPEKTPKTTKSPF
jgi:hypothetical protein